MGQGASSGGAPGKAGQEANGAGAEPEEQTPQYDSRLPFSNFRELYTMKNFWKAVKRGEKIGNLMLFKYLSTQPDNKALYNKLRNISSPDASCSDPAFEAVAAAYLKVFDDVVTAIEEKPADVSGACDRLVAVGKMHRTKVSGMESSQFQTMEEPFIYMVKEVLLDRFNDKAETLFRKFFQFCLKYLLEGFNK